MASSHLCIIVLLTILLLGAACENPNFCPEEPYFKNCMFNAGIPCTNSGECPSVLSVCDVDGQGVCVQCTEKEHEACSGTSSTCLVNGSCGSCTKHDECESLACLPDGSCADPDQVAYVQARGTGLPPCAKEAPCGTLQQGITAVNASIPYIKVSSAGGVLTPNATTTIDGKAVVILADPSAKLARMGNGPNLVVSNVGADVQIYDLEIAGASDVGISIPMGGMPKLELTRVRVTNNMAGGISAVSGIVTVAQSTISGNAGQGISMDGGTLRVSRSAIYNNSGGGILVGNAGTFDITNCFIFRNGDDTNATVGGVSLSTTAAGASVFSFNTIVDNRIRNITASAGGIFCDIPEFVASNNIIARNFRNKLSDQNNSNTYPLSPCVDLTSTITLDVSGLNFVSPENAPYDYHLKQGSAAIDQAMTPSMLAIDIDGDSRPQGNARDQGADEVP